MVERKCGVCDEPLPPVDEMDGTWCGNEDCYLGRLAMRDDDDAGASTSEKETVEPSPAPTETGAAELASADADVTDDDLADRAPERPVAAEAEAVLESADNTHGD